jgi:DsrE/DsrF/DsrH-like protein
VTPTWSRTIQGRDYALGERYFSDGLAYTLDRDMDSYGMYLSGWRARCFFEQGRWAEAQADAKEGFQPLREVMQSFVSNGGQVWACGACAKPRGITDEGHGGGSPDCHRRQSSRIPCRRGFIAQLLVEAMKQTG